MRRSDFESSRALVALVLTAALLGGCGDEREYPTASGACALQTDSVLAEHAVGPRWLGERSCLPEARIVYVDHRNWNLRVMGSGGERDRCLTCDTNVLGANFPLDSDGDEPKRHWKGAPEPLHERPWVLLSAENEHSPHKPRQNTPSIGWNNDIWALNLCSGDYSRLTELDPNRGLQHSAISEDDEWFVYPLRYAKGEALQNFGRARMVFARLRFEDDTPRVERAFTRSPLGEVYYEPNDIRRRGPGRYSLYYVAGDGTELDPYRYDWCPDGSCEPGNTALAETSKLHEEFLMVSPSRKTLAWMRGPQSGLGYHADLFLSTLEFGEIRRVTYYNDCRRWPDRCLSHGGQLSALNWSPEGQTLYFGLWRHGRFLPFADVSVHALEFAGSCGG